MGLCVGLILLVALAVTAVVELREHYEDKAREAREQALADRAAVQIASDQRRRARLAAGAAETLTPRPGAAPCPHQIRAPALLGRRVLPGALPRAEGRSAFEAAAGLVVVKQQLDLMPARREGVGPVARRLHADAYVDRRARPFEVLFQQTFVVTRWQDPGILRDTEAHLRTASGRSTKVVRTLLGEERITELGRRSFRTGIVAGRLLVWDLERRRFACVSPEVEVVTPRLTLVRHSGAATKHVVIDDVLNKARLETLLAAIRAATRELRQIAQ